MSELPYKAWLDGLEEERKESRKRVYRYNNLPPEAEKEKDALIREIFGKQEKQSLWKRRFAVTMEPTLRAGNNFYANFNCVILDVAKVVIGENVMFAPNVAVYTAGHPVHPDSRNSGYEYGIESPSGIMSGGRKYRH